MACYLFDWRYIAALSASHMCLIMREYMAKSKCWELNSVDHRIYADLARIVLSQVSTGLALPLFISNRVCNAPVVD